MIETKINIKKGEESHYSYPLLMVSSTEYSSTKENSFQIILATGEIKKGMHWYLLGINLSGHGWPIGHGNNNSAEWDFEGFRPFKGTLSLTQN